MRFLPRKFESEQRDWGNSCVPGSDRFHRPSGFSEGASGCLRKKRHPGAALSKRHVRPPARSRIRIGTHGPKIRFLTQRQHIRPRLKVPSRIPLPPGIGCDTGRRGTFPVSPRTRRSYRRMRTGIFVWFPLASSFLLSLLKEDTNTELGCFIYFSRTNRQGF